MDSSNNSDEKTIPRAGTETVNKGRLYPESPFRFNQGARDTVNLHTGSLGYEDKIASIPGKNGLNLDLTLIYNSNDATSEKPIARYDYNYRDYYSIWVSGTPISLSEAISLISGNQTTYNTVADRAMNTGRWWDIYAATVEQADLDQVIESYFKAGKVFESEDLYEAQWNPYMCLPKSYVPDINNNYVRGTVDFFEGRLTWSTDHYNEVHTITYENPFEYMGDGWSFNFPRVIIDDQIDEKFLRLPNGSTFRYQNGVTVSNLKNYLISDIILEEDPNSSYKNSKYKLYYKDGLIDYFDGKGRIIGRKDRFGNIIDFKHTVNAGYNGKIVITDTASKLTTIDYTPTLVTVTLPDQKQIKYTLANYGKGKALTKKQDQLNRTTTYGYSANTVDFNFFSTNLSGSDKNSFGFNLLTSVTYPTNAVSQYTYDLATGNTNEGIGRMQYYRASSRKDVADNINYHTENFSYSNNNFTGYPSNKGADSLDASFVYSAAIALENNNKYTHTFNNKQLEIKTELSNNNALKMESNYVYDNKNQLSSVEQKIFGVAIQNTIEFFEFDDKGDLAAYWDKQAGSKNDTEHKRSFTYDSRYALRLVETYKKDNVTIITDSNTLTMDGKSVSNNKFYTNNILTGQTDYTFDSYGNVLTKTSYASASKSIVTTFTYSGGVHLLSESRGGITLNYTYDIMGRRLTSKDGNHYQISYAYDGIGRVTQITNPDNSTVQNGCDDTALTMTSQNEIGLKIKTIYGKLGIVKQIQDVTQTSVILETNTYDAFLRLSSHTDARGLVTAYSYDYLDRVLTKTTGGAAYQEIYNYDDALTASSSRVTKTIQGETNAPSITTVTYTNLYGFVEKDGGVIDNVEQLTTFTYDYLGDQLASTTPDHITASFQYDGSNRLIKTTNPDGSVYQQAFDWIGRKTSSTDPKNAVSLFTYDDADRLTQEEIPFDESYYSVKNYFYDSNSNITSQRQSNNKPGASATKSRIDYQYNNRNYLIKVSNYDSNAIENYVTYTYDAVGNKLTMSAANETQTTSYLYDKRSRLIKYTDPMGGFETYIYDNNNNLLTKTDRMNTVVTNDYDALNRLYSITARKSNGSVADEYMMYQYYKTGAKKQEKNESLTTEFVYDSAGRVIQQTETTNAVTTPLLPNAAIIKTFGYDVRGNRISLGVSRNGITDFSETYEYDSMNRLMKVYDNDRLQATYSYDLNGNRQTLSCGGMFAALTSYNTTAYNLNKIRTYGSGIVTRYAYNSANLVTSLTNSRGNQVISSYQYTYKLDGNQDSKIDSFGVSTVYTYDDLGRLTNETETMPAGAANTTAFTVTSKSYTFDSANNRQSMIVNTEVTPQGGSPVIDDYTLSYNYNKRNQLLSETLLRSGNKDAVTSYLYDLNGNCTLKVSQTPINGNNNTVMTSSTYNTLAYNLNNKTEHSIKKWEIQSQSKYFYDVFNRMIEVERGSSSSAYRYKADGLRVSISVSQSGQVQTEFHVWDGSNIIALLDGAGGLLKRYIRGIGLIKNVIIANDAEEYFIFNAHGDVVQLTNADGVVIRYYYYSAFGVELKQDPNDTNVWRYCEEYWDIGSNAYYLRARYYDPASSRMLSEDNVRYVTRNMPNGQTIIEPLSLNLCTYCANNPVMYVDPTGHEWYHWAIAAGFVVAAGAALIITAGGATPAVIALASVANGMAAATTASTLAAGAFIGSSMAFAGTLMLADTSSVNAFKTSGNWGTVSVTAFGGAFGTAMGGFMSLMNRNPASSDDTMMLFRGDKLAPDKVFKNGFIPKGIDNDFDAYYAHLGGVQGNFISSSSDVEVAKLYAGTNGYIYVYTTSNYIDTNAFLRTYSQYPLDIEFTHCGAINASDIVGAFAVKNGEIVTDFIANLNYRGYSAPNLPSGWLPPLPPGRR